MSMYELEYVHTNRGHCNFCRLLLAALSSDPGVETVTWERSAFVLFDPELFGRVRVKDESRSLARMTVLLVVDSKQWSTDRNGTVYGHGIQVAVDESHGLLDDTHARISNPEDWLLKGRKLRFNDRIDLQLARQWLEVCETTHQDTCAPHKSDETLFQFRCIDVQARCVKEFTFAKPRYIALSYVWGDAKQVKLGKDTVDRLFTPGGLNDECQDIPRTIRDTMLATAEIGERYLWVDALCIRQDSDEDRNVQISNMDAVYGGAVLTIAVCDSSTSLVRTAMGFGAEAGHH